MVRYGVFQVNAEWLLYCNQRNMGRYPNRMSALTAGRRAAHEAMGNGLEVELLVMEASGEFRPARPAIVA